MPANQGLRLRRAPSADGGADGFVYDAFISYGSNDNEDLARSLQRALLTLAKPWYRFRVQRIFLDQAELAAGPDLRADIERALAASRWLILLASPAAAASRWVDTEVSWWLVNNRSDNLIVAATSPDLIWDEDAADWAVGAKVPPSLRGALSKQPKFVNLTEAAANKGQTLSVDTVAEIAAPIRGKKHKSELVGEHLRERRRTRRIVAAAVSLLAVLTAAAVTASVIAVGQRNRAIHQAEVALSRQLAATSESQLSTNLRVALLLAAQAYETNPNDQTYTALIHADLSGPELVRYVPAGSSVTAIAASANGMLVAGLANGKVLRWNFADPRPKVVLTLPGGISALAVSQRGSAVIASDGARARLWRQGAPPASLTIPERQVVEAVGLSPSGRTAVLSSAAPFGSGVAGASVLVINTQHLAVEAEHNDLLPTGAAYVSAPSDRQVVLFDYKGLSQWRSVPSWHLLADGHIILGATQETLPPSSDGRFVTINHGTSANTIPVWPSRGTSPSDSSKPHLTATIPLNTFIDPTATAFSPDDSELAAAENGVLYVAPIVRTGAPRKAAIRLTGSGNISDIAFVGSKSKLVSVSGTVVAEWNLHQLNRISTSLPTKVAPSCAACGGPTVVISPDSTNAAISWAAALGTTIQALPGIRGRQLELSIGSIVPPVWDSPRHLILPLSQPASPSATGQSMPKIVSAWTAGNGSDYVLAAALSNARKGAVILVDSAGKIYVQDDRIGTVLQSKTAVPDHVASQVQLQAAARSAPDLVAVAKGSLVRVINPYNAKTIRLIRSGADIKALTFSDDKLLIEQSDGNLEIWSNNGSSLEQVIPGDQSYFTAPVANDQGTLAAIPLINGSIQLLDLLTGTIIYTIPPYPPAGTVKEGIAFSPDGKHLIVVTDGLGSTAATLNDAYLIDYRISGQALVRSACTVAGGSLSASEWRTFTGSQQPQLLACKQ
jgi:WD40 repeat protein